MPCLLWIRSESEREVLLGPKNSHVLCSRGHWYHRWQTSQQYHLSSAGYLVLAKKFSDLCQLRNYDVQLALYCEGILLITAADLLWQIQLLSSRVAFLQTNKNQILPCSNGTDIKVGDAQSSGR